MDIEPTNTLVSKLYCYRRDFLKKIINSKDKYSLIKGNIRLFNLFSSTTDLPPAINQYPKILLPNGTLTQTITPPAIGDYGVKSMVALQAPYSITFQIRKLAASTGSWMILGITDTKQAFVNTGSATHMPLNPDNGRYVGVGRHYTTVSAEGYYNSYRTEPFAYLVENYTSNSDTTEDGMFFTIRELTVGKMEWNIYSNIDKITTFNTFQINPYFVGSLRYLFLSASAPAIGPSFNFKMVAQPF